eukprot:7269859-Prorocentrum_lima.AAC.1
MKRNLKQKRSVRIQRNVKKLFLLCIKVNLSIPILEQPWSSGCWRREFADMAAQFHRVRTDGCAW